MQSFDLTYGQELDVQGQGQLDCPKQNKCKQSKPSGRILISCMANTNRNSNNNNHSKSYTLKQCTGIEDCQKGVFSNIF